MKRNQFLKLFRTIYYSAIILVSAVVVWTAFRHTDVGKINSFLIFLDCLIHPLNDAFLFFLIIVILGIIGIIIDKDATNRLKYVLISTGFVILILVPPVLVTIFFLFGF